MPKKPDRFERAVEKHVHKDQWNMPVIHAERAAKLLRAEHAWMWGMITTVSREYQSTSGDTAAETLSAEILHRLAQRRK